MSLPAVAEVGALIGDPARANMLAALMDGQALTASELAYVARVTPQTASGHLAKLADGQLVAVERQGRHRYYRLANPLVGRLLEAMMTVAADGPPRHRPASKIDEALRRARTCYDHLAGQLGVDIADALVARRCLVWDEDGGHLTPRGIKTFERLGVDLAAPKRSRRAFCRPCLDWSERRPHLAGSLGAALTQRCFDLGWIKRVRDSRAVAVTDKGKAGFADTFGLEPYPF
jgi:DNA-binding transcriptional ArsR family regulator